MEPLPDLGSLSESELKSLIDDLEHQEHEVSYQRRLLHGKIDILRAELVARLQTTGGRSVLDQVDVDLDEAFGEVRFVMDPNSAPKTDPSTEHIYQNRNTYLPASSPQYGRLVGWYEEGVLLGT